MPCGPSCAQRAGMPVKQGFAGTAGRAQGQPAGDKRAVIVQPNALPAHDWCALQARTIRRIASIAYALPRFLTGREA